MSLFDPPPPEYERQQRLWVSARDLDLPGLEAALAAGAPPEPVLDVHPHGRQSPLALAVGNVPIDARRQEVRHRIIDRLLRERSRHPGLPPPVAALEKAFEIGDRQVLEKLLPWFPDGVNHVFAGGSTLLDQAVVQAHAGEGYPAGRMTHVERLRWVLDQGASLKAPAALPGPLRRSPLCRAIFRLPSAEKHQKDRYAKIVDLLIERGATLRLETHQDAVNAAIMLVKEDKESWSRWLVGHLDAAVLDDVEAALEAAGKTPGLKKDLLDRFRAQRATLRLHDSLPSATAAAPRQRI